MNIGDVTNGSLSSSKHLKHKPVDAVAGVVARTTHRRDRKEGKQDLQDSIAISDEARRALEADQKQLIELKEAREALDALPELSEDRMRELKERIESGFYLQDDIIDQVAEKIAGNFVK